MRFVILGYASELKFVIASNIFNVRVIGFRAEKRQRLYGHTGMLPYATCMEYDDGDGLLMSATTAGTRFSMLILRAAEVT